MSQSPGYRKHTFARHFKSWLLLFYIPVLVFVFRGTAWGEGTKQLEPLNAPPNSVCKLVLLQNDQEFRIPFALMDCKEDFRLNIRINNPATEKIYLGFGHISDYFHDTVYNDVRYRVKDPAGNVVAGFGLQVMPGQGDDGFIQTRNQVDQGPDIDGSNPDGYTPLVIKPLMKGDYVVEFQIPTFVKNQTRIFKYIDITVAKGIEPIPGRLWSKAWQLGSGSVSSAISATYSLFYIYTSDSIVTRFDCNGMAGGVWDIYSNEWGCSTTGSWNSRRRSIPGNATVKPQYKIFLNDPDSLVFPSGHIGKMNDLKIMNLECDTVITFAADVSKAGNIEILIDVPPYNPNSIAPEDVKLTYAVKPGFNILLPAWDGKDQHGIPVENGTQVLSRIRFINGLSNVPLYDVEDNPNGFKVDIQRPVPASGSTRLELFWDDTQLPSDKLPTFNLTYGCLYSGSGPVSGCHAWNWKNNISLGDTNTINTWWYLPTDAALNLPVTLKLRPSSGLITGTHDVCDGNSAEFSTEPIPFARKYIWNVSGQGVSQNFETTVPDNAFRYLFPASLPKGKYTISVFGRNPQCRDGESVSHIINLHNLPAAAFDNEYPCQGAGIAFTDHSIAADAALAKYSWTVQTPSGGQRMYYDNPAVIVFNDASNYKVSLAVTDAFGCSDTVSSIIQVMPKPNGNFDYIENSINRKGDLHFNNFTTGASQYYWDFGNNFTTAVAEPDIIYSREGDYTIRLVATGPDGCSDTTQKQYYYLPGLWLPNAFSPDGNQHNDIFRPVTQRTTLQPYQFLVFSRWGQLVFSSSDPAVGWDGTFEGKLCKTDTYSYLIQYSESEKENSKIVTQRGTVNLIR